tara:strand:- start:714 stop:935 length:222 start_codon:yes stop_codon:yes gene_type:complete
MSTWQLFSNDEVIDTKQLQTSNYEDAHTYFRLQKNLDSDVFNKLFIVKEYIKPKKTMGKVEWWKGESTQLDDF